MAQRRKESIYNEQPRVVVPYSKMGIKILSEQQIQNIFPTYETLLDRVEAHRRGLQYIERDLLDQDIQYNLMFDNVYSIMGKRGAGKTSVVFSLKEILKGRNPGFDIVLPIIMPEMIPQDCSIIGWVLSLLEEVVKKLDDKMTRRSSEKFNGCLKNSKTESLSRIYENTKNLYYAQYYNVEHTDSFIDAVVNTDKMTQNSYDFSKQLISFWYALISAVKDVHPGENKEPLIHIIFDDVDLVPEAAIKLFSTIIKYLSHPNIVVYVTADEELIFDVIENNMTKRLEKVNDLVMYNHVIGGLKRAYDDEDSEELLSFNDDINKIRKKILIKEELIHETPKRYGEKVLPPSCRYYLETFDSIEKKKGFIVDRHNGDTGQDEMYTIEEFLTNEIDRYLKAIHLKKEKNNFVIITNEDKKVDFIAAYLLFWGSTSRQLTNEVYILREFVNRLIKINEKKKAVSQNQNYRTHYCRRIYQAIWDFAYTTLIVSGNVTLRSDEIKDLLNELLLYSEDNGGVYIDYLSLRERAERELVFSLDTRHENELREYISLFVLAFFIENFLKLENLVNTIEESEERKKVHGMGLLVDVLDYYCGGEYSLVCKKIMEDVPTFLWYYGKLLDQPQPLLNFRLSDPRVVRDYFATLPKYTIKNSIVELNRTSPVWVNTIAHILYFSNERIYNITRKEVDVIRFNREDYYFYDLYYTGQQQAILESVIDIVSMIEDTNIYAKYMQLFKDIFLNPKESTYNFSVDFKEGETIGELAQRMRKGVTEDSFQHNCAVIGRKGSKQVFADNFGTAECSESLYKELQSIREEIMQIFYEFEWHKVYNLDTVEDELNELSIRDVLNLQELKVSKDGEVIWLINSRELHRLFNQIRNVSRNNRNRFKKDWDERKTYEDSYRELLKYFTVAIRNNQDFAAANRAIILFNYYSLTQILYILSFQRQAEITEYNYIDRNVIPYKNLYEGENGIKSLMKKKDYIGLTMREGIKERVSEYIYRFAKRYE